MKDKQREMKRTIRKQQRVLDK